MVNNNVITKTLQKTQHLQYVALTDGSNCGNYVLEYNTQGYISEQGVEQYRYIQQLLNTTKKLETLCKYVYNDDVDRFSSEYFVVCTNGKFLLLNFNENTVTTLGHTNTTNINEIHKYVLGLMSEV